MKKMLLVFPKSNTIGFGDLRYIKHLTKKSGGPMNAALSTIASLTPKDFDIKIVDENFESIPFDEHFDLVGLTGFPPQLARAQHIAKEFTKRGVLVVAGGPFVSVSPERWRNFSDVLVIGEAERIWPQFVKEYLAGKHKNEYRETERYDLTECVLPDYSSISKSTIKEYLFGIVQTSRGCPYDCEFCDVIVYVGRKMRYKPIPLIMQEIEQLYQLGFRIIFLADDNFTAGRKQVKAILSEIREWNHKKSDPAMFVTQLSIDIAKDDEILKLAAGAGLTRVLIGIETPNKESLKETQKFHNVRSNLIEDVKKFHQYGILVTGSCIVGFDHDDLSIFKQQLDFFTESGTVLGVIFPLQAPDGTRLKDRMIREGRYIDEWEEALKTSRENINNFNTFTILPKLMTIKQLQQGTLWLYRHLYTYENFTQRLKSFFDTFENSPVKDKISIPKMKINAFIIGFAWRILIFLIFKATKDERKAFIKALGFALRSSHPQGLAMAVGALLSLKNYHKILRVQFPDIDNIRYPVAEKAEKIST